VFVSQHYGDPFGLCFVLDVGAHLAVIPLAGALVVDCAFVDTIGNGADIAIDNGAGLALDCLSDDGMADFVFQVAHHKLVPAFAASLCAQEFLVTAAAFLFSCQSLAECGKVLGVTTLDRPALATGDDGGAMFVANYGWVNLARIDTDRVGAWGYFGRKTILDHDVPVVAAGSFVVDQAHFDETQRIVQ
jgi:hypothetical protein